MAQRTVGAVDLDKLLSQLVASAEAYAKECSWRSAASLTDTARTLSSGKPTGPMWQRIAKLNQQLDAEGQRRLRLCRQNSEKKNFAEAFKGYTSIILDLPRRPCAAEAKKELAAATAGNPERQRLLAGIQAREMEASIARMLGPKPAGRSRSGATRVQRIKSADAALRAEIITELERLAKKYPASAEGKRAAADLKALRAGKDFQAALNRPRAR